jgi:tripartite ATP-independent transporter DctM subunit
VNTLSPEINTILMLGTLLVSIFIGYPIAFALGGIGLLFGISLFGFNFIGSFSLNFLNVMKNYSMLAIPLFILMGTYMERSGVSDRLFGAIYLLCGRLRGGLAVASTILSTIFAGCTGVVGADVVATGLLSLPAMLKRGYNKYLACGIICAGGCLGVLIPPSVMVVIYGPTAGIPVGKLLFATMGPGLALSASYMGYALIRCYLNPKLGPPIPAEELAVIPIRKRVQSFFTSLLPPGVVILCVLGFIYFGVTSATEAAATGVAASAILAFCYKKLDWKTLSETSELTLRTTSMILTMTAGAVMFVSTFISMGGGDVVERVILGLPMGKWGILILMLAIIFVLGMFLDWVAIILLVVPLYTPIATKLGFDAMWFATMVILNLQLSYLTPPFALACFYLKGITPPDISLGDIYKSVMPFIFLQIAIFVLCAVFPEIILWIPSRMEGRP